MPMRNHGFTYLGLLFAMVLLGVALSVTGTFWHTQLKREKEQELLFVGEQYRKAIADYRAVLVNGQGRLPNSLDELLQDRRFPMPVRHLRKRYADPVANSPEWGLVRSGDGIAGVFSLSREKPLKQANFGPCCAAFAKASSYTDWKFAIAGDAAPASKGISKPAPVPPKGPGNVLSRQE